MANYRNRNERYFVGISLPDELSTPLAAMQQLVLQRNQSDMRTPILPHITLINPSQAELVPKSTLIADTKNVALGSAKPSIELTHVELLAGRTLYIAIGSVCLQLLYGELITSIRGSELVTNTPFEPHITLAQSNRGEFLKSDIIDELSETATQLLPQTFTAESLDLFSQVAPRRYEAEPIAMFNNEASFRQAD